MTYCNQDPAKVPSHILSWVADWTRPHGYETIASNKGFRRWNASKDQKLSFEYVLDEAEDFPRLSLDGVLVDTITWISELRPPISQNDIHPDGKAAILAWILSVLNPSSDSRARTSDRKHVCWSLVAGLPPLPSEDQKKDKSERRTLTEQAMETLLSPGAESTDEAMEHRATCFFHRVMSMTNERRVFRTASGRVGLGSEFIVRGDKVAIFLGAQTPFVIRESSLRDGSMAHKLVGEAYVDGIMEGEFFDGSSMVERILLE